MARLEGKQCDVHGSVWVHSKYDPCPKCTAYNLDLEITNIKAELEVGESCDDLLDAAMEIIIHKLYPTAKEELSFWKNVKRKLSYATKGTEYKE